jgi:hypothetical protein
MTPRVYNVSLVVALALIGAGLGLVSVAAALVTVGALVLLLTLAGAYFGRRR